MTLLPITPGTSLQKTEFEWIFPGNREKLNGDSVSVRQAGGLNNNTNNKTLSLHILKCQKDFLANDGMGMIEGLVPSCCN